MAHEWNQADDAEDKAEVPRHRMADDLERGRRTEVEDIQGEVVALARSVGVPAPINARLLRLIHDAEARGTGRPRLSAAELWPPESP